MDLVGNLVELQLVCETSHFTSDARRKRGQAQTSAMGLSRPPLFNFSQWSCDAQKAENPWDPSVKLGRKPLGQGEHLFSSLSNLGPFFSWLEGLGKGHLRVLW